MPAVTFATGNIDTFTITRPSFFFITNTSICDTAGNLLFYTNGVNIFNANHDTLLNSVGFNPGYISTINCNLLAYVQGVIIIPKPGHDSIFSLFHLGGEEFYVYNYYHVQPLDFRYTEINIKQDNGKGAVDLNIKTKPIVVDTLVKGFITAVRHGNGRDWWMIVPRYFSNLYYKFLLTPDSLLGPYTQNIGKEAYMDPGGGSVFSKDGSIYAQIMRDNRLNIYKFDRCTGMFYDSTFIQVPNDSLSFYESGCGIAISPSNKFLYVITFTKIYQYDLQATNIAASQIQVAEWDSSNNPVPTIFFYRSACT
jgi:hypothetical protein